MKHSSLVGNKYGKLLCLELMDNGPDYIYKCICDCGKTKNVKSALLKKKKGTKSCGCLSKESGLAKQRDLTGIRVGKLIVIKIDNNFPNKKGKTKWICKCDCGNLASIRACNIQSKHSKSCGCLIRRTCEDSPSWRGGGKYINNDGYYLISHVENKKQKYVLEHRIIIEKFLGRKLLKNENVHHVNGIRTDNRLENLELWITKQPKGQRVNDLIEYAEWILKTYKTSENQPLQKFIL